MSTDFIIPGLVNKVTSVKVCYAWYYFFYLSVIRALTVNWMVNMDVLVANFI